MEGSDIEDFCLWTDLLNEEDCSISNVGLSVDNSLCMSEQDSLSNVDVASIGDFDSEDSVEDIDFFWRTVFRWMVRMSSWPTVIDEDCSQLFRSLGRMCVLDVHVGQTDVPTESPGDVPRRCLLPSLMSLGDGELVRMPAMNFPRTSATPGELCTMDVLCGIQARCRYSPDELKPR